MGLDHDNADFQISTVFDNGRLPVRRRQRASDPTSATGRSPVRVPRRLLRDALLHRTDSLSSRGAPDRDCPDCGDIEQHILPRRELCAARQREGATMGAASDEEEIYGFWDAESREKGSAGSSARLSSSRRERRSKGSVCGKEFASTNLMRRRRIKGAM
uniref:Uncharacterized protein n=1 Tax=Ixodes ricinus TaxID=34613 RepID=A0A090XA22_IXORI